MVDRIKRVNSLIKEEVSRLLDKKIKAPKGVLITVTRVETTQNLEEAKVWISVYPDDEVENIFEILEKDVYQIQQKLNKELVMHTVPKIVFKEEDKTKKAAKIEKIIKEIREE